jgi:hypothetical protein
MDGIKKKGKNNGSLWGEGRIAREAEDFFKACETIDAAINGFWAEKLYQRFFFQTRQTPQGSMGFLPSVGRIRN